jgi:hypothetical protein
MLAHRTQPKVISNEELPRHAQEKLVGVKTETVEMEKTYNEEVFFCHRRTSFELEPSTM